MSGFVERKKAGLWVVDVQERLFPLVDRHTEVLERICLTMQACSLLELPLLVTEQYPDGLGHSVPAVAQFLKAPPLAKTSFSGYLDPKVKAQAEALGVSQWILVGIEAHICVLQTAKDLLATGHDVIVLNDATSSRSLYDFATGIGEMRDVGVRISSSETVIYEIIRDASSPEFKRILPLIKSHV